MVGCDRRERQRVAGILAGAVCAGGLVVCMAGWFAYLACVRWPGLERPLIGAGFGLLALGVAVALAASWKEVWRE